MKILANLLLVFSSTLLVLGLLEGGTRLVFSNEFRNHYDFRLTKPEPYQKSDYFSKAFIDESILEQPGKWINPEGTRLLYPADFKGQFFTIENHLRRTTNTPDSFVNKILLFGGSTVYNSEVPDSFTIASYLQRLVNLKHPNQFQVVNFGVTSINTAQQLERLKTLDLDAGDLVIFYGGYNDGMLFTTGRIDGWIFGENMMAYKDNNKNLLRKIRMKLYRKLHKKSEFVERFFNPYSYQAPPHLTDTARIAEMQEELAVSYLHSVRSVDSLCRSQGTHFYNFLQPHLLTRAKRTDYEEELLKNPFLLPPSWLLAQQYSYEVLEDLIPVLAEENISAKNLTNLFDNSPESFYLDYCHLTETGNRIIADAIFAEIFENNNAKANESPKTVQF